MVPIDTSGAVPQLQPLADLDEAVTWAMVESSPDGVLLTDEHGVVLLVNSQIETLFGDDRVELLGLPVEALLPERHRQVHKAHRTRYSAVPRPRAMGSDLALMGRHQHGTEFPVEVSLSPITDNGIGISDSDPHGRGLDDLTARAHDGGGGTITLDSHPDRGTTLNWITPRQSDQ